MHVLVVGAGLSGLSCALDLIEKGIQVTIVEASDGVGGRLRTDEVEGFRLDRGFQVAFTGYPSIQSELTPSPSITARSRQAQSSGMAQPGKR